MAGQKGLVHLGDNIIEITSGAPPVVVEEKTLHKLANPGSEPLVVIEIQSGNYLEEDDVIRVE
jgi:mannose-6-phosphate isomerase-like protein (cupin superfamily)